MDSSRHYHIIRTLCQHRTGLTTKSYFFVKTDTSLSLPVPLSTLLAVPIPSEHATRGADVQLAVERAVRESFEQGIDKRGKEVTPWLLKRVGELTGGTALDLSEIMRNICAQIVILS